MRIELDRPRCEGHGLCEEAAPQADAPGRRRRTGHRCPGGGRGRARRREGGGQGLPGRRAAVGGGMTMRRIVVVGNGIAGLTACDSLRSAGFDGELTVVGAERHHPYSRPALSKALLHGVDGNGDDGLQAHELPEPTHEATELLGVSATGLDIDARVVRLDGGGELPYDGLVIASGSRAKRLAAGRAARRGRRLCPGAHPAHDRGRDHCSSSASRRAPRSSWSAADRSAWRSRPAACTRAAKSRSSPRSSPCRASWVTIWPGSSPPPPSGAACGSSAAGRPVSSIPMPGHGLSWPTAPNWRRTSSSPPSATSQTSTGWPAPRLLVDGSLRVDTRGRLRPEIVAAGDVAFFPTSRGRAARARCGPAPSTRPRSLPSACSRATRRPSSTSSRTSGRRASVCRSSRSASLRGRRTRLLRAGQRPGVDAPALGEPGRLRNRRCDQLPDPHPQTAPTGRRRPGALRPAAPVNV